MTPFKYNMTLKEYNRRRAILKALLQVYVDHRTIVEGGLSLVDVSTSLSWSRAQTEALVETLVSEGYLYSTHDTDHYQITAMSPRTKAPPVASQGQEVGPGNCASINGVVRRSDASSLRRSPAGRAVELARGGVRTWFGERCPAEHRGVGGATKKIALSRGASRAALLAVAALAARHNWSAVAAPKGAGDRGLTSRIFCCLLVSSCR